jgi:hypothetical protein
MGRAAAPAILTARIAGCTRIAGSRKDLRNATAPVASRRAGFTPD